MREGVGADGGGLDLEMLPKCHDVSLGLAVAA